MAILTIGRRYFMTVLSIFTLFGLLFSNASQDKIIFGENLALPIFEKFYIEINKTRTAFRDSANAFLEASMTGVASSAPRENFIINVDIPDTVLASDPDIILHISTDSQETWSDFTGYRLGSQGFTNTWEALGLASNEPLTWYITGTADAEVLFGQEDWGRLFFTQMPFNTNSQFPVPDNLTQILAYDYTEAIDSIPPSQDIIEFTGSYDDNGVYFHIEYGDECISDDDCAFGPYLGPWNFYLVGVTNPISPTGDAFAFLYAYAGEGIFHPGMIKLYNTEDGNVDFTYLDNINFSYYAYGNSLDVFFSLDNIVSDDGFGSWPNESKSLITMTNTFKAIINWEDFFNSEFLELELIRSTIILNTPGQTTNISPILSNGMVNISIGEIKISYQDADGNLPVFRQVQICDISYNCSDPVDMLPLSHDYEAGVEYLLEYNFSSLATGSHIAKFSFSDANLDAGIFSEIDFEVENLFGDMNGDGTLNVLDVVQLVNCILNTNCGNAADVNEDGAYNVLDVVNLINLVLFGDG